MIRTVLFHNIKLGWSFQVKLPSRKTSTVYALSSGQGKCGVAVIRVSGPESVRVLNEIAGLNKIPEPRKAILRHLKCPKSNDVLDQGLVLWFPGPHSFTGEDCCELQVHGGLAVVSAVLSALSNMPRLRPALPGEFTKRAFYNNKLDLTEVEGLADLINAETEMQRRQALYQMEGSLNKLYNHWCQRLKRNIAHVEAYIDFSEDQNIEENILKETHKELECLQEEIQNHLKDGRRGERIRDGVRMVIVGAPNVGKSSLLNALSERPAAIVSSVPGTTRDVISSTLDIAGFPVVLSDTAGLRQQTTDLVENEGMQRAYQMLSTADLVLLVVDSTHYIKWIHENVTSQDPFKEFLFLYIKELKLENSITACKNLEQLIDSNKNYSKTIESQCLIVFNKIDLVSENVLDKIFAQYPECVSGICCSGNIQLKPLMANLENSLKSLCGNTTREAACLSRARHRYHLTSCVSSLDRYLAMSGNEREIDLAAQQLRQAINALGHITGHVSTEQILDQIFSDFCIGK